MSEFSGHFRSIRNFFFDKMADVGHFGCPKFTFWPFQIDMQLYFCWKFLTKWLPAAILDVPNSLSIAFLVISDRYATCFWPPAAILNGMTQTMSIIELLRDIWMSNACVKFEEHSLNPSKVMLSIFIDFSIAGGHFGCPQITFDSISGHFRSIRNLFFCFF